MKELTASEWDSYLSHYPDAHLLQTTAWGEIKAAFGWDVVRLVTGDDEEEYPKGAQVLFRRLPFGRTLAYIPKGPLKYPGGEEKSWKALWADLDTLCRRRRSVFLKVEPDDWDASNGIQKVAPPPGFRASSHEIQPRRTLLVDLSGDEARVLGGMKQKTRYNVRLALKKGVIVRSSSDLETFYQLVVETGQRDEFGVHSQEYYRRVYEQFQPRGECEILLAEFDGEPLAALMVFAHGRRAWYFYGASTKRYREYMPTYILQWEAMRWARAHGCIQYDLWGVPDEDEETLEASFTKRSGGLWGVYRFKRGFGGELCRTPGAWDRVYQPVLYAFYRWWAGRRWT